ncbi:MAG TPA: 2-dehydropantoate 2-reductase [Gaiellales bacterium]
MTRVAIVGVGAIGATMAAAVQASGRAELVLCGRTPAREVIVDSPWSGSKGVMGPVLATPADVSEAHWVLLAVKAHQTPDTLGWLRRLTSPDTVVAVLQNGVEHRERVVSLVPAAEILPAVIWFGARTTAPGRVTVNSAPRLTVPDSVHGRAFADLIRGGVEVDLTDDFVTESWRKLCRNAVAALMALTHRPAEIFRDDGVHSLALRLAAECIRVGRAEGAVLPDSLAREIADGFARQPPDSGSSILADAVAGRPLEWDARNGVIRRLGARHGIPTPVSDTLVPLLACGTAQPRAAATATCGAIRSTT